MFIRSIEIKNFKSFQDVTILLNSDINIFTGKNNSGKTTVLEAIALWHECFTKLIRQAGRATKNYNKGDYILGNTQDKYFPFYEIHSVRSPNFDDIFYERDKTKKIELTALLNNGNKDLVVSFQISVSGLNYVIELIDFNKYDFKSFNNFFQNLPVPISLYYASPVPTIRARENFATLPQVKEAIQIRESSSILRNRLYSLYRNQRNLDLYRNFIDDLSYILFDNQEKIEFYTNSDIQKDTQVILEFQIGKRGNKKDINLLGSGSLQIIEILLNLYDHVQITDLNIILLDEPDSHIHRDIQKRLLEIITKFADRNQVIMTTHNESLIRHSDIRHLFHLENSFQGNYKPVDNNEISKLGLRFKGIYPSVTNPIISSLGNTNGLDFINGIESDRLIFVEGEDDARAISLLLQKSKSSASSKKYVFWVLNGVNHIFNDILSYKTVFSVIKNQRTLWEKSVLIFDRDFLNDAHYQAIAKAMKEKLGLETYISIAYTFEATLLTELDVLSRLLAKWIEVSYSQQVDTDTLRENLHISYQEIEKDLQQKYLDNNEWILQAAHRYIKVRDSLKILFARSKSSNLIVEDNAEITMLYQEHLKQSIITQKFFKLTKKEDVSKILNEVLQPYHISFDIENDFIDLLRMVDHSTWFKEWDFLLNL
ncbi:AAA family ATPase [Pseudanabaena sp. FACHB-1277]|uniref:AAA family ATPase n=1 Tax=Pseudanabaena cinerea FACHB-1277 TaxID=2949581 RepID=A0A926Z873_9CYAN|nr:ATP-binding protein [Pseudanabaena cinerea]MBD2150739.1 AAA family ATPase [Pseudanabaena cinerea FACHB-1277]